MDRRSILAALGASLSATGCLRLTGNSTSTQTATRSATSTESATPLPTETRTRTPEPTESPTDSPTDSQTPTESPPTTTTPDQTEIPDRNGWPQYQYGPHRNGFNPNTTGPASRITESWRITFEGYPKSNIRYSEFPKGQPVLYDGTIYLSSNNKSIFAIDAATGEQQWEFTPSNDRSGSSGVKSTPVVYKNRVIAESKGGWLYGIDRQTGEFKWVYRQSASWKPVTPLAINGFVYTAGPGNTIAKLRATDGAVAWVSSTDQTRYAVNLCYSDGTIYATELQSDDREAVHALDATTGKSVWRTKGVGGVGGCSTANGLVFATKGSASDSNDIPVIAALDQQSGKRVWQQELTSPVRGFQTPSIGHGRVYVPLSEGKVQVFDVQTGKTIWEYRTQHKIWSDIRLGKENLYISIFIGDPDKTAIICLTQDGGLRLWQHEFTGRRAYAPIIHDKKLYVTTKDSHLIAFKENKI